MKKALAVIMAVCTALVLTGTMAFYIMRNSNSGSLHIRTLTPAVPAVRNQATTGDDSMEDPVQGGLVNINTADIDELMTLPGIGEVLARRIIDYRNEHGHFDSPAGLLNVSGIGEKKLEAILELITTGGNT